MNDTALASHRTEIAIKALAFGLERIGWEARDVDIDLVAGRVVVELMRSDGRLVRLTATEDYAVLERFHRRWREPANARRPQLGDGLGYEFLGRIQAEGPRSGLRALCSYVADNPAPGLAALPPSEVRHLLRPLMR